MALRMEKNIHGRYMHSRSPLLHWIAHADAEMHPAYIRDIEVIHFRRRQLWRTANKQFSSMQMNSLSEGVGCRYQVDRCEFQGAS